MKRKSIWAFLIICALLCMNGAVAEWAEGRSPSKPYPNVDEVDLTKSIGYMMLYPKLNKPAEHFCDSLQVFLPRQDVTVGEGAVHLFLNGTEIFTSLFNDSAYIECRSMTAEELDGLLWGEGTAFVIHLPSSLQIGSNYYVTLDAGCIVDNSGKVLSPAVTSTEAWQPRLTGSYGIESLSYMREGTASVSGEEEGETSAPEMQAVARNARKGDRLSFRLVLGGDAASAVLYNPDITIDFDDFEMMSSGTYTGTVIGTVPGYWGIVFLDAQGNVLDLVEIGY